MEFMALAVCFISELLSGKQLQSVYLIVCSSLADGVVEGAGRGEGMKAPKV